LNLTTCRLGVIFNPEHVFRDWNTRRHQRGTSQSFLEQDPQQVQKEVGGRSATPLLWQLT
jgi:hypothetical protein